MAGRGRTGKKFEDLVGILRTLRSPGGCPWDRAQDALSIRDYFLEEVYEAVEALDRGDEENLAEELGDVLMEVVFLARIFEEKGKFTIDDALDSINAKMIVRHPHVFGRKRPLTAGGVAEAWHKSKLAEKPRSSVLRDPGRTTPALLSAFLIGRRVSAFGFDWPDPGGALEKVREETSELGRAIRGKDRRRVEEEIGDLFFALANVGRKLGINPETALRRANRKFIARFRAMEIGLRASGTKIGEASLGEMDAVWEEVKRRPRASAGSRRRAGRHPKP
jgi:tetrapyrrole methylase family protein / MazG family protein